MYICFPELTKLGSILYKGRAFRADDPGSNHGQSIYHINRKFYIWFIHNVFMIIEGACLDVNILL